MKKILSLLISMIFIITILAGCKKDKISADIPKKPESIQAQKAYKEDKDANSDAGEALPEAVQSAEMYEKGTAFLQEFFSNMYSINPSNADEFEKYVEANAVKEIAEVFNPYADEIKKSNVEVILVGKPKLTKVVIEKSTYKDIQYNTISAKVDITFTINSANDKKFKDTINVAAIYKDNKYMLCEFSPKEINKSVK